MGTPEGKLSEEACFTGKENRFANEKGKDTDFLVFRALETIKNVVYTVPCKIWNEYDLIDISQDDHLGQYGRVT
jgi:hypothetical protein